MCTFVLVYGIDRFKEESKINYVKNKNYHKNTNGLIKACKEQLLSVAVCRSIHVQDCKHWESESFRLKLSVGTGNALNS